MLLEEVRLLFGYEECDGFWLMVALAGFDGRSYILIDYLMQLVMMTVIAPVSEGF